MAKFLDSSGLSRLWSRVKSYQKSQMDEYKTSLLGAPRMRYRGKCLYDATDSESAEFESLEALYNAVHTGDFSNIYIGDYIKIQITTEYYGTENVKLLVADIDYYLYKGQTRVYDHHLVLITQRTLATPAAMETITGGYIGSHVKRVEMPKYATAIKAVLNNHIINIMHYFSSSINANAINSSGGNNTGAANSGYYSYVECFLPSETQIYGMRVYSQAPDVRDSFQQLMLFVFQPWQSVAQKGESTDFALWLLSSVASSTSFCAVNDGGGATTHLASAQAYLRPLMLFG